MSQGIVGEIRSAASMKLGNGMSFYSFFHYNLFTDVDDAFFNPKTYISITNKIAKDLFRATLKKKCI